MKQLSIAFLKHPMQEDLIDRISFYLDDVKKHTIDNAPWPAYAYKPEVRFSIVHTNDCIFLKYDVQEAFIKAVNSQINTPVYQDTCVEFFISLDEKGYYNFEFNCIGTCLAAFGKDRNNRQFLPEDLIRKIRYQSVINNSINGQEFRWTLTVILPLTVFEHHHLISLSRKRAFGNFYKCGDHLPHPHFITWAPVQTPEPDFHVPEYFGELLFE